MVLLLLASLLLPPNIHPKAINQDHHRRILFLESWNSSYLISTYNKPLNSVRFAACDVKIKNSCENLATIPYDELELLEPRVLEMLRLYRYEIAEKADSSLWYFLSRGAKKSQDVKAMNEVIQSIETQGLAQWILLHEKPIEPSEFSTPAFAHELMARLKNTLTSPAENIPDCP